MISRFHLLSYRFLAFLGISWSMMAYCFVSAITLTIPPSDGFQDVAVTGPQQVEGQTDLVYSYIQLANQYLWFAMIVICFAAVVYMGYKLMTSEAGTNDVKTTMKNTLIGLGVGLVIAMMSYTIVRLVINIL